MTNAEARFNNSLRPRKPEGLLGRTAQDVHLDSHTAPYEPAGRAQRAERLPSTQRDQGAICSALGEHPQDPSERGAGPGALTPVVRTGSHAPPLENGSSPSHRHRGARSATGPRAAAVRAAVPGVQRGRAPPVPPPHPARL